MRIDDPRLEASQKAMFERIEKYNAIVLAVTKGHLAIEDAMDGFIEATASKPSVHSRRDSVHVRSQGQHLPLAMRRAPYRQHLERPLGDECASEQSCSHTRARLARLIHQGVARCWRVWRKPMLRRRLRLSPTDVPTVCQPPANRLSASHVPTDFARRRLCRGL